MLAADVAIASRSPSPPPSRRRTASCAPRSAAAAPLDRARQASAIHLLERALARDRRLPAPLDLVRALSKIDRTLAEIAWSEANRLRARARREPDARADGPRARRLDERLAWRHYGVALDELGHIEHDDTVWLTVRRNKPLLVDSPTSKARATSSGSRAASSPSARRRPRARRPTPPLDRRDPHALRRARHHALGDDEEVRRAYKRQREIYAPGARDVVAPRRGGSSRASSALDEAYDTLLDPIRRRAYDLSTFPEPEPADVTGRALGPPALAAEQLMLQGSSRARSAPTPSSPGAPAQGARVAGVELARSARGRRSRADHLAGDRGGAVRRSAGARLRARLPRGAREVSPARPGAGPATYCGGCARRRRGKGRVKGADCRAASRAERTRRRALRSRALRVALVPGSTSRCVERRAGLGRALLRLRRAAHREGSATPTTSSSAGRRSSGTRGVTTRSATARSSRSSTGLGASHAVAAMVDALTGAALAVVTWARARQRSRRDARGSRGSSSRCTRG
jgi:hypothetical protein